MTMKLLQGLMCVVLNVAIGISIIISIAILMFCYCDNIQVSLLQRLNSTSEYCRGTKRVSFIERCP